MRDVKPILFSGPMVRALLEGRKTQTRRVLTKLRRFGNVREFGRSDTAGYDWHFRDKDARWHDLRHAALLQYLPFAPGDLLWVRETWAIDEAVRSRGRYGRPDVYYLADRRPDVPSPDGFLTSAQLINMHLDSLRKRPAIHMPRWASRFTLEVTAVKVERLVEITEEDALAEGFTFHALASGDIPAGAHPIHSFRKLWDSLNAKRGYGWEDNPYVTVVQFSVFKLNVDAFLAQRKAA